MRSTDRRGLRRNQAFGRLWAGQTVSMVGSQMTLLALPLTAVLTLHASAAQMGVLGAVEYAPFIIVGLPVGALVDRLSRRRVLIVADVTRCLLLATIPLAAATGTLRLVELYAVAYGVGVCTVFFDVAYLAVVPSMVAPDELVDANSRLEASRASAQILGPAFAGGLVQALTAPAVILVDSLSFAVSAGFVGGLHEESEVDRLGSPRAGLWREVTEGLRAVVGHPVLRALAAALGTFNLFSNAVLAVYVLYAIQVLDVGPTLLGVITAAGGVGALGGALAARRASRVMGVGPATVGAMLLSGVSTMAIAAARGPKPSVVLTLVGAQVLLELSVVMSVITVVSLRQSITPARQEGRISATMRFVIYGGLAIGALMGGLLGQLIGLRSTVLVGAVGELAASLWLLISPVRRMRRAPDPVARG